MQKADRDTAALTVLGLLHTGPRHPYEMHLMIERTHKDFVTGLPRSIYHAAERLVAAGHIRVLGTSRGGARPERTVYQLTEAGEIRLREWVRLLLEEPNAGSSLFVPALTFAGCLRPGAVRDALRIRHRELTEREAAARQTIGSLTPALPRILVIKVEYEANRLLAERDWVATLIDDLTAGRLDWAAELGQIADIDALIGEAASTD